MEPQQPGHLWLTPPDLGSNLSLRHPSRGRLAHRPHQLDPGAVDRGIATTGPRDRSDHASTFRAHADERKTGTASISRVEDEEEDEEEEEEDDDDEQREPEDECTRGGRPLGRGYTATQSVLHFCNNDALRPKSCKYATSGLESW